MFKTLNKFGFHDKLINWIKECVTSVSFSILVNNGPTEMFVPRRGLRQGDSLFLFLFILCAKVLARKLQFESNNNNPMGFPIVKDRITIPFLAFADDIIIFGKAQQAACQTIRNIIDDYCGISGQCVNYHKSSFQTTAKVTNQTKMTINAILNISYSISLDKYLCCPIKGK